MGFTRLPFPQTEWAAGSATELERKKSIGAAAAVLLEFAPGFVDPAWCTGGHIGLVLDGEISFDLDDSRVTIRAGEGFVIDAGTRHRALNSGERPVQLFVVTGQHRPGAEGSEGAGSGRPDEPCVASGETSPARTSGT